MSYKTRTQLVAENASLLACLPKRNPRPSTGERETTPKVDARLEASEIRYRRLFETAKDGILILDADTGQIADVNPFLEDMLGFSRAELLGRTLWEIGPFRDVAASQHAFRRLQNQEYIRYDNLPLETKTGQHKQVEFVSNVYWVNDQRVIQCNIRDITARKQAEVDFQKANEELVGLVAELQRRDREMQVVNRMNDLLLACMTQEEAYQVTVLIAGELFAGQSGGLAILHPSGRYLELVAQWGNETILEASFSLQDCWAMRRGQPHEVTDPTSGLLCHHFSRAPQSGSVCVPLSVHGETLGVFILLGIAAWNEPHRESQHQLAVMVGEAIKLALSNLRLREKLHEQAMRDALTGLFNRRYLDETLPRELHRAERAKSPLCVVMLDLDHFKKVNDQFGHEVGDLLLQDLSKVFQTNLRKSDLACRQGGDEFLLVLTDSSLEDTAQRLEQIRKMFKDTKIRHHEQLLGMVMMSAGIVVADHGMTAGDVLRAADKALYAAKQSGSDQVAIYQAGE